jgi:tetratricopeptide (TPR) repeat protein
MSPLILTAASPGSVDWLSAFAGTLQAVALALVPIFGLAFYVTRRVAASSASAPGPRNDAPAEKARGESALRRAAAQPDPLEEARALGRLGQTAYSSGDLGSAEAYYRAALQRFEHHGGRRGEAVALAQLGRVARARGDLAAAREHLEAALVLFRKLFETSAAEASEKLLAEIAEQTGQAVAPPALAPVETTPAPPAAEPKTIDGLVSQGVAAGQAGDLETADRLAREALALAVHEGSKEGQACAIGNLGIAAELRGDQEAAAHFQNQALALYRESGVRSGEANTLIHLGKLAEAHDDAPAAEAHYAEALALAREMGNAGLEAHALSHLGALAYRVGEYEGAALCTADALGIYEDMGAGEGPRGRETAKNLGKIMRAWDAQLAAQEEEDAA